MTDWGLPPECARVVNPRRFPPGTGDDQVLQLGVATELAHPVDTLPLTLVQDETDNGDPSCAIRLPDAVAEWNASGHATAIVIATPDGYFEHLLARFGTRLPVRRGEWGGDWDVLRATEPVWSWRLRQAMDAVGPNTTYPQLMSLATVIDHNIGLGPRWAPYLSPQDAAHHVADVVALYRQTVSDLLGPQAVSMLPPPPVLPAAGTWPASWRAVVGPRAGVARVRVGPGFPHRDVNDSMVTLDTPVTVRADGDTLVVRTRLVRSALAQRVRTGLPRRRRTPPDCSIPLAAARPARFPRRAGRPLAAGHAPGHRNRARGRAGGRQHLVGRRIESARHCLESRLRRARRGRELVAGAGFRGIR